MKVVEKECHVPARTYIDKKYIASDGKEFSFESDCLRYEEQLAIGSHPIYATAIKNAETFYDSYRATLYYISSKEDYDFFKKTQGIDVEKEYYFDSNFNEYGAGWYLCHIEDGGDYPDNTYLWNYDAYEKMIESELEEYKSRMRGLIDT